MKYSPSFYYYLSCACLLACSFSCSETHASPIFFSRMLPLITINALASTTDGVGARSDHTPHTLHQAANCQFTHQQNMVSRQGNHQSDQTVMNITNPARQIQTRAQWHAWFDSRRAILRARLKQAEQAEWNWPCTRRRCEIMRIEDEIRALDAEEFVVPF